MDMNEFVKGMAEIEAQVAREAEILFDGKDDCSDEEAEIILSSKLDLKRSWRSCGCCAGQPTTD